MKNNFPHILQTPAWGRAKTVAQPAWTWKLFVKLIGESEFSNVEDLADWSKVESSVLVLERDLPFGQKMQYVPRGPFIDWNNVDSVKSVLILLENEAKKSGVVFTRVEPDVFEPDFPYDLVKEMGFVRTDDFVQAQDTVKVEINKPDEELMASFHSKHRYNIRLAEKRGLTVRSSTDPRDVSIFYQLTKKTDTRKEGAMNPHPEEYYQSVVRELAKDGMVKVYVVEKDGVPVSSSIVFIFGEEAIYMFGAADYEYRRDMPNHLREWASMRDARDVGCKWFDLWGVTMRNDPGEGIKRYKLGYRDHVDQMAGTFDYAPVKWKYELFNIANRVRRMMGR